MGLFLETERLSLRYAAPPDLDLLYELNSDPEVIRYLFSRPRTRAQVEAEVLPRFLAGPDGDRPRCWIAVERVSKAAIGGFALETAPDASPDEAELGYRLRRDAWGRGYAAEGARALVDKGFTGFGLRRVWAQTMAVNAGSRRVMEKAGLHYVRTFHLDFEDPLPGTEQGEVEYALTRADWLEAGAGGALPGGRPKGIRA